MTVHKFFLTFGSGTGFSYNYAVIEVHTKNKAEAYDHARRLAFDHFSDKWSILYTEEVFDGQVEKYDLHQMAHLVEDLEHPVHAKHLNNNLR